MLQICSILLFSVLSFHVATTAAQSPQPQTVLDYYQLLPEKYFEASKEQRIKWMLDPKRGAIVDVKNGYIFAPGDGAQTTLYVCLFKKVDGNYVIGVKSHYSDSSAHTHIDFYNYKDGKFIDITKSILPIRVNENLRYEMPRYGRTIKVTNKAGRKLYDLIWQAGKFRLRKH